MKMFKVLVPGGLKAWFAELEKFEPYLGNI